MTDFIGKGEVTTSKILGAFIPYLTEKGQGKWPETGLYVQLPIKFLVKKNIFALLSSEHQKGSIDVVAVTKKGWRLLFRVQGKGHQGWHKAKSDAVQEEYLREANHNNIVINLNIYECTQLFKERFNFVSMFEVASAMISSGVRPVMI